MNQRLPPAADTEMVPARCIAITGPTAVGKSAAALAIARRHGAEIISVDSALVYRGMDIGTAKPSAADQALVPHHLLNFRDPMQAYSAAEFVRDASGLIAAINGRGKLALLVGGSMMYFRALLHGIDDMPAASPLVRAAITQEAQVAGWPAMHRQLAMVDASTAARLAPADSQRIQRALEVYRVSGRSLSSFQRSPVSQDNPSALAQLPLLSLEPDQRGWLHHRIELRFDAMLAGGFLDEVCTLRARGDLHPDLPSMRCVGYRQAWEMLDGLFPPDALRERTIAATRQLAKRQLTWLRAMPQRRVVPCDQPDAQAQLQEQVDALLKETA